jgi:hypothetical protein
MFSWRPPYDPPRAMKVHCEHCGASYPVDDRLLSRSTYMLCAACGLRHATPAHEDSGVHLADSAQFVVRTARGGALIVHELAELQAMLRTGELSPHDELEGPGLARTALRRLVGLSPSSTVAPGADSLRITPPYGMPSAAPHLAELPRIGREVPEWRRSGTLKPPSDPAQRAQEEAEARAASAPTSTGIGELTIPSSPKLPTFTRAPLPSIPALGSDAPTSLQSITGARATSDSLAAAIASSDRPEHIEREGEDARGDAGRPVRRRRAIASPLLAALLGALLVLPAAVHFRSEARVADARAKELTREAERALAAGDAHEAHAAFARAGSRAALTAHEQLGMARAALAVADDLWLRKHIAPTSAKADARFFDQRLALDAPRALALAEEAVLAQPTSADALALRADALRVSGAMARAAAEISSLDPRAHAGAAYAAAMLALSADDAVSDETIARLEKARRDPSLSTRATSALVWARVRRSDAAGARVALAELEELAIATPVAGALAARVDALGADRKSAGPQAEAPRAAAEVAAPRRLSARELLRDAMRLVDHGEHDRAERALEPLTHDPRVAARALVGLSRIARAQSDDASARERLRRALALDPSDLAARVAMADLDWDSGRRDESASLYRSIMECHAPSDYPERVRVRSAQASPQKPKSAPAPLTAPPGVDPHGTEP